MCRRYIPYGRLLGPWREAPRNPIKWHRSSRPRLGSRVWLMGDGRGRVRVCPPTRKGIPFSRRQRELTPSDCSKLARDRVPRFTVEGIDLSPFQPERLVVTAPSRTLLRTPYSQAR